MGKAKEEVEQVGDQSRLDCLWSLRSLILLYVQGACKHTFFLQGLLHISIRIARQCLRRVRRQ